MRKGNVFIIIVAVMAVIFTVATFFMKSTIEEKHQTERSHRSIQVQCVAEAALERAFSIISREINNPEIWKFPQENKDSLAFKIRMPMQKQDSATLGGGLGESKKLDTGDFGDPVIMKRPDLEGPHGNELTQMVEFMAGVNSAENFEAEVTISIDKAFSNAPASDYKVPGVEIPWACHSGVKQFLDNEGYIALVLSIPDSIDWLSFSIPLEFAGVTFFEIDIIELLETAFPAVTEITQYRQVHTLLSKIFETFFPGSNIYPYEIKFSKDIFPTVESKIPYAPPAGLDAEKCIEKLGYLRVESKAIVVFPDGQTITKRIEAVKEFKCADIEPPASLYSLFIANGEDRPIDFNVGGNLTVNNFSGFGSLVGEPAEPEKREFPGLIRVNGNERMDVNVGFIGNPSVVSVDASDNFFKKLVRPAEWLLMLQEQISGTVYPSETTLQFAAEYSKYTTGKTPPSGNTELEVPPVSIKSESPDSLMSGLKSAWGKIVSGAKKPNIIPPSPAEFGVSIIEFPFHFIKENISSPIAGGSFPYPFGKWEWPMMGMGWSQYRLPIPTPSKTVTHFFGTAAAFPTMTREVEGFVLKSYRQWHLGVISWTPVPIPGGKAIPIPWPPFQLLPFPLPYWHTHDITNKYEYNLWLLKSPKDNSGVIRDKCTIYDPADPENKPPNLYTLEQYGKKAGWFYLTAEDFYKDIPNRMVTENGRECFKLDGVTFVRDSIELPPPPESWTGDVFTVSGRGSIVSGGFIKLRGSIEDAYDDNQEREADTPRTIFSLLAPKGWIEVDGLSGEYATVEGSIYSDKGILLPGDYGLKLVGNFVANDFSKGLIQGQMEINYAAYKTRSSMASVHPEKGVYDPERYHVSFAPAWESWRVQ